MGTFSERYGLTAKTVIQRETASTELRTALWNILNRCIWSEWKMDKYGNTSDTGKEIDDLVERLWLRHFNLDLDNLPPFQPGRYYKGHGAYEVIKQFFFKRKWHEVFDFIEFMAKDKTSLITGEIAGYINNALTGENSAYRLVGNEIVEITDEQQIAAIEKALEIPMPPVREHFTTALELLGKRPQPDYRNSIKESISAVEAACREVSGEPKATLGDALKKMADLHPALQKAFSSFYGYTNDADGIRHALLDQSDLGKEDATFMLVACSAFVGYLFAKKKS